MPAAAIALLLTAAVAEGRNILVAGGTGSGKTTLANALLAEVAGLDQRVVIIEDTRELRCDAKDAVVETVPENRTIFVFDLQWTDAGWRAVTIRLGQESTTTPTP